MRPLYRVIHKSIVDIVADEGLATHALLYASSDANTIKIYVRNHWREEVEKLSVITTEKTSMTVYGFAEWSERYHA